MEVLAVQMPATRRIIGAAAVIALHIVIIWGLLYVTTVPMPKMIRMAHEMIVWFPVPAKPAIAPTVPLQSNRSSKPARQPQPALQGFDVSHLPPVTRPQVQGEELPGVHMFLFDCKPEDLDKLTSKQRAQCIAAGVTIKPVSRLDAQDHTNRSQDARR